MTDRFRHLAHSAPHFLSSRFLLTLALGGVVLGASACTSIIGIEDTELDPNAGTAAKSDLCGNDTKDDGEQCDGEDNCASDCTLLCGNGTKDDGEQCDGEDNCASDCTLLCGNDSVDAGEECDGEENCKADCTYETGYDFTCLDQSRSSEDQTLTLSFDVTDLSSEKPLENTLVKICGNVDFTCLDPVEQDFTDASGQLEIEVQAPFKGSIEFSLDGYVILHKFRSSPVYGDTTISTEMLGTALFDGLAGFIAGGDLDPDRGHITAEVRDCKGDGAPGLSLGVTEPEGMSTAYVEGTDFVTTATETGPTGRWAGINIVATQQAVTAYRGSEAVIDSTIRVRSAETGADPADDAIPVVTNLLLSPAE